MSTLLVISGPTAVGKTELSIFIAQYFNTSIINADSRQIYGEMTIGTAKPTAEEREKVKHYFVDSHSISEDYTAGKFGQDALELISSIFKEKDIALLSGGSGLYIKAVCEGFDDVPESDPKVREDLLHEYREKGLDPLLEELKSVDLVPFLYIHAKGLL